MSYPKAFLTPRKKYWWKSKTEKSADGTPRYIPNPNADATYCIVDCMRQKPIYGVLHPVKHKNFYREPATRQQALIKNKLKNNDYELHRNHKQNREQNMARYDAKVVF